MFFFTEPGFYEDGEFGIRIEDIVQIVPANVENDFKKCGALTFKTVTMCPIQTKLINVDLMTTKEVKMHCTTSFTYKIPDIFVPIFRRKPI